jgi:hypothetical protein
MDQFLDGFCKFYSEIAEMFTQTDWTAVGYGTGAASLFGGMIVLIILVVFLPLRRKEKDRDPH